MKRKRPLDQEIYLTEYLSGTVAKSGLKDIMKMEKAQEQEYTLMLKREYGNPYAAFMITALLPPVVLILEQPDLSTAIIVI